MQRATAAVVVAAACLAVLGSCSWFESDSERLREDDVVYELNDADRALLDSQEFSQDGSRARSFEIGHTLMDFWATFVRDDCLQTTFNTLERGGAEWVLFMNWAGYAKIDPPEFGPIEARDRNAFRTATAEEIQAMASAARERGMRFALGLELNYDPAYMNRPDADGWDWDEYLQFNQDTIATLNAWGDAIEANPTHADAVTFWNAWFHQYEQFLIAQAQAAEASGIEVLIIGKQLAGAVRGANDARWRNLISNLRAEFSGSIAYAGIVTDTDDGRFHELSAFPIDALDAVFVVPWASIMEGSSHPVGELTTAFTALLTEVETSLADVLGDEAAGARPEIRFITPFQSHLGAEQQRWFEPALSYAELQQMPDHNFAFQPDTHTQARMYEAFFQSVAADQFNWVSGVWSWGFWWRNDPTAMYRRGDASFDLSSSVRNKPAVEVMRRWGGAGS